MLDNRMDPITIQQIQNLVDMLTKAEWKTNPSTDEYFIQGVAKFSTFKETVEDMIIESPEGRLTRGDAGYIVRRMERQLWLVENLDEPSNNELLAKFNNALQRLNVTVHCGDKRKASEITL